MIGWFIGWQLFKILYDCVFDVDVRKGEVLSFNINSLNLWHYGTFGVIIVRSLMVTYVCSQCAQGTHVLLGKAARSIGDITS